MLRGNAAERVGLADSLWSDTLRRWLDEGYPRDDSGNPVDPAEVFGFDMAGVGGFFDVMPRRGQLEIVEETDEWAVKRNGFGASLKWWKNRMGTPEHVHFHMTSREIWEREYRPYLLEPDPARLDQEHPEVVGIPFGRLTVEGMRQALETRRAEGYWTHYGHLFLWENLRQGMGDACMYESLLTDPDWVHDFNRVYTDFYKIHFEMLLDRVGKPDGVWIYEDLGYKHGLCCSPGILEDLIFPYYAELVDLFHRHGLAVVLHSCGGIEEALPLIVEAGFDALNPMEAKADCCPLRFAERYGDRLAFVGGLDVRVLESGDRDLIRREVLRLVIGMKERGARYIFGTDHSVSPNVAFDDYRYALEVYRDNMTY